MIRPHTPFELGSLVPALPASDVARAHALRGELERRALTGPVDVISDPQSVLDEAARFIHGSGPDDLRMEAYRLDDGAMEHAIVAKLASHPRTRIEALRWQPTDRAMVDRLAIRFGERFRPVDYGGGQFGPHGEPYVLHAKTLATPHRAMVSTGLDRTSRNKGEIAMVVHGGNAAQIFTNVDAALRLRGADAAALMRRLAARSAEHGILVNDAYSGAAEVARGMRELAQAAGQGQRLHVLTSELRDPAFTSQIVQAKRRGAHAVIKVGEIGGVTGENARLDEPDAALLRQAGIAFSRTRADHTVRYPHANVIALEDVRTGQTLAYAGTGFPWRPHLAASEGRDVGLLLRGQAARDVLDAQQRLIRAVPEIVHSPTP